jgi:hypothetical protein
MVQLITPVYQNTIEPDVVADISFAAAEKIFAFQFSKHAQSKWVNTANRVFRRNNILRFRTSNHEMVFVFNVRSDVDEEKIRTFLDVITDENQNTHLTVQVEQIRHDLTNMVRQDDQNENTFILR